MGKFTFEKSESEFIIKYTGPGFDGALTRPRETNWWKRTLDLLVGAEIEMIGNVVTANTGLSNVGPLDQYATLGDLYKAALNEGQALMPPIDVDEMFMGYQKYI